MSNSRAEDEAAIKAVLVDSYKAWDAGDADGMVADYTEDATAIMTGSLRDSRDVIRKSMALSFEGPLKGSSTCNKQLSIRFVGRDGAIVVSESGILFAGETEVPDPRKVNATWVFEKQDGRWLIAAYHNSPVLAPGNLAAAAKGRGVTAGEEGFERLVEPFRTELLAYCYRMLGTAHDAEDLVQDTYLRAWRGREEYDDTRSSLRTWLYRIATNACLTALAVRSRRPLPSGLVAASDPLGPFVQAENLAWLQPLPDSLLDAGDPARAVIDRSSLRLAFAAALQHLSSRERGALILRDVLSFSASEAAEILGSTVISVNSSLQRARTRMKEAEGGQERLSEPSAAKQRAWVDRYMKAFEHADVEGLKRLLTEDVLMEMPPMLNWFAGRSNYGLFMEWVFGARGTDWRLKTVAANGQPGFAAYQRVGDRYELHTLQIFTVTVGGISRNSVFQDSEIFAAFGLTVELEVHSDSDRSDH